MKKILAIIISITMLTTVFTMPVAAQAASVGRVTALTVSGKTTTSVSLKWKRVKGATGYQVYYSTSKSKNFKRAKTIKKGATVKAKVAYLSASKTYYFKVRAVRSGRTGKFSKTVAAKTAKAPALVRKMYSSKWRFKDPYGNSTMTFTFYSNGKVKVKATGDITEYATADDFKGWTYQYIKSENACIIIGGDGIEYGLVSNMKNTNKLRLSIANSGAVTLYRVN